MTSSVPKITLREQAATSDDPLKTYWELVYAQDPYGLAHASVLEDDGLVGKLIADIKKHIGDKKDMPRVLIPGCGSLDILGRSLAERLVKKKKKKRIFISDFTLIFKTTAYSRDGFSMRARSEESRRRGPETDRPPDSGV